MTWRPGSWLPLVAADRDAPAEKVAMVHRALQKLPEAVAVALWREKIGVCLRPDFDGWDDIEAPYHENTRWDQVGGYWDRDGGRWAVINAKWVTSQADMDAVVLHELGHAMSDTVLPHPHRRADFREAWKAGRDRVRRRWPTDYAEKERLGVYCIHWTRAVQETWAESFAWIMDGRATTHPAFGDVFRECVVLVQHEVLSAYPTAAAA